jgi:heat shock protein HtpX
VRLLAAFAVVVGAVTGIGWLVTGAPGAVIAGASALLALLILYANASPCVLRLAGAYPVARDVAPDLYRLVERLVTQAGLSGTPRLYWLPGDAPNALATGRDSARAAIAMTPALLTLLTRDELAGVLTRELACIARRYTVVWDMAAALAGGLMLIASWRGRARTTVEAADPDSGRGGSRSAPRGSRGWRTVLILLSARLVRAAGSVEQVHAADAEGARVLDDPFPIARALERLAAANSARPVRTANSGLAHEFIIAPYVEEPLCRLFRAHPPLAERVERLNEQALEPTMSLELNADRHSQGSGTWRAI